MLRHAVSKSVPAVATRSAANGSRVAAVRSITSRRGYAAQGGGAKRALNEQQLKGSKPAEPAGTPPPPAAAAAAPPADNGNMMAFGVIAIALAGGGAYYYYNMEADEKPAASPVAKEEVKEEAAAVEEEKPVETPKTEAVTTEPETEPEVAKAVESPKEEEEPPVKAKAKSVVVSVQDSLKELREVIDQEASEVTKRAHQEVMRNFDESLFEGLDDMSVAQLKAKIMQLATEMKDRTKWEALRLKEFLAMKEKETADKYLDVLQKQRLEFESILARRLMEQEHELTLQSNSKLQDKDGAVKEMIEVAIQKLTEEHEMEKEELLKSKVQEFEAKYQQEYLDKVAELQKGAISKLEQKAQTVESLTKKVKELETALATSRNFHEDSLQAHKLSAAALALAEKMESNQGAGVELGALKAVAGRDNVISAALSSIPSSMADGVPTLPELQARFDKVASKTRQAALVPAGQSGLEGQLAGMLFASLKFPPKPDDPSPEDDKDAAEYVLVRARQLVQLGELEKAIQQLDKLKGQAAFTVAGWKKDATDRVAVEQALKVIKMECALLNESMSKVP